MKIYEKQEKNQRMVYGQISLGTPSLNTEHNKQSKCDSE